LNQILDIDYTDFYYNGYWLSDFDGMAIGRTGQPPFSLLPTLEIESDKIMGNDGEFVYNSFYNPRTFTVPVTFNDISKLRQIAGWLHSKKPTDFYYKNDDIKISVLKEGLIEITPYTLQGITELKFIAHDPFFYAINDTIYLINKTGYIKTTVDLPVISNTIYSDKILIRNFLGSNINILNEGNIESYPIYVIIGTGNVSCSINNISFNLALNSGGDKVFVDTKYLTVYDSQYNRLNSFDGNFPLLKSGMNTISTSGNIQSLQVKCRSRWI
jgi:predicted phage tail component-like protein